MKKMKGYYEAVCNHSCTGMYWQDEECEKGGERCKSDLCIYEHMCDSWRKKEIAKITAREALMTEETAVEKDIVSVTADEK